MTHYPVQLWYPISALICVGVAALFAVQLWRGFEPGALIFCALCLAIAAWQLRAWRTHVALGPDRVVVVAPLAATHEIEFRQLLDVVQEGRVNPTILIMYHPRQVDGLLNLDAVCTVSLPGVRDQTLLLERLESHVPR